MGPGWQAQEPRRDIADHLPPLRGPQRTTGHCGSVSGARSGCADTPAYLAGILSGVSYLESTHAYRQVLADHPNAVTLFATRRWRESQHRVINESLRLLDEGGVPAHL